MAKPEGLRAAAGIAERAGLCADAASDLDVATLIALRTLASTFRIAAAKADALQKSIAPDGTEPERQARRLAENMDGAAAITGRRTAVGELVRDARTTIARSRAIAADRQQLLPVLRPQRSRLFAGAGRWAPGRRSD
jgi:hypothetical protein